MKKLLFVFATDPKTTIGGAENMTFKAIKLLEAKGVECVLTTYGNYVYDCENVVFTAYNYDDIKHYLYKGFKVSLIGYTSFYYYIAKTDPSFNVIDRIGNFLRLMHNPKFRFICMTLNDKKIANLLGYDVDLGVNLLEHRPTKSYDVGEDILYLGRISYQKNILELCKIAANTNMTIKVTACPTPYEGYYFNKCIKELSKFPNIRFIDPKDDKAKWENTGCLILTSRWETMPLVTSEALSRGVPCVEYDCVTPDNQCFRNVTTIPQGYYHDAVSAIETSILERNPYVVMNLYSEDKENYEKNHNIYEALMDLIA